MQKEGQNVGQFFNSVKAQAIGGTVQLGSLLKKIEMSYPQMSKLDIHNLVKQCQLDNSNVDIVKFEQLLQKGGATGLQTSV